MPGLTGIIQLNQMPVNTRLADNMRQAITHCDWYQTEDYASPDGFAAVSRIHLGVANLTRQPFQTQDGKIQIFLHGEVFLENSAGFDRLEAISRLYEKYAGDFAAFLKGSFIIVILDNRNQTAWIANDRLGSKPLYYFYSQQALYFSPEIKSLLCIPELPRRLHLPAIADWLANGQMTTDHTLLESVKVLDNATVIEVKEGTVSWHRYWDFEIQEGQRDRGPESYREELGHLLRQAVHRCLQTDGRFGILLSGGYDSRSILGCALEEKTARELNTVSWGRDEEIPESDCLVANQLAHQLGTQHGFYLLSGQEILNSWREFVWLGESLTDFPESYQVFNRIRQHQGIEIVLRGDECFGYSQWKAIHDDFTLFRALDLRAMQCIDEYRRILHPIEYAAFSQADADLKSQLVARCAARNIFNRKDFYYFNIRVKYYLNPLNYVKTFALESFRPLLDDDLINWVRFLPVRYRYNKWLWRKTVVGQFPYLYKQIAQHHNMIDWVSVLRSTPAKRLVYTELLESPGVIGEIVKLPALKQELDHFYAPQQSSQSTAGSGLFNRLSAYPQIYHFAHKLSYHSKKLSGRISHSLPPERLILRLLILKTWNDVFLNAPISITQPIWSNDPQ